MIRIPAVAASSIVKAGSFLAARGRRAHQPDAKRGSARHSGFLRTGIPDGGDLDPDEPRSNPGPTPTAAPSIGVGGAFGRSAVHDADIVEPVASAEAAETPSGKGPAYPGALVAGLSAALTATVIAAVSWRADGGIWAGASLLTLAALTTAFLAGRAVVAPPPPGAPTGDASRSRAFEADVRAPPWRDRTGSAPAEAPPRGEGDRSVRIAGPSRLHHAGLGVTDVRGMRATGGEAERLRRHVRIRPRRRATTVVTDQGARYDAEVLDLSQSGVALEGTMPGVWIGSMVTVGSRRAKAVRMIPQGMALEFSVPIPARALHADTVL